MTDTRTESDSFGPIDVPADAYWGAQTQRSIGNLPIGDETMPLPLIHALGIVKHAAAIVNEKAGLESKLARAVQTAAEQADCPAPASGEIGHEVRVQ